MSLKNLNFTKVNPTGNITLLYNMENIDKNDIQKISKISMNKLNLHAEQVGFINNTHLQMMGGEFCGNACRSFASYLAFNDGDFLREKTYKITCSGEESILQINVRASHVNNIFLAKIKMPKNISIKILNLNLSENKTQTICEVVFSGIVHFIVEAPIDNTIVDEIRKYCKTKKYPAFGIMFFDFKTMYMTPYVEVQGFEGVWENSCGSGTTAVGYYLNKYEDMDSGKIIQPGGWLEFSLENDTIFIDGPVEIVAMGTSYIDV